MKSPKPKPTAEAIMRSMADILGSKEEIDQDSLTIRELAKVIGIGRIAVEGRIKKSIADGKLEKVLKKDHRGILVTAYRPKRRDSNAPQ